MTEDAPTLIGPSSSDGPLELDRFERQLHEEGFAYVAGVDEAGRGALAGPVVAAAAILRPDYHCRGLDDSKKLDAGRREELYEELTGGACSWAVGVASAGRVDRVNVLEAALGAMKKACERLRPAPDMILVDGNRPVPTMTRQKTIVKGDGRCACIAAASIIAKVYRDHLMDLLDARYPGYDFANHKGYGTATHLRALEELGPTPAHRRSFAPVARLLEDDAGRLFAP
jgi:ribonuclease HII